MGAGLTGQALPRVHANAESPSIAGLRTCVSDPLDHYCTRDEFFNELISMFKEPVSPTDLVILKDIQVEEVGPTECNVKVILDGASLTELDSPEKSETSRDVVRIWLRLTWDLVKYEMCIHTKDIATGKLNSTIRIHFLKDPFRIEAVFVFNPQNADPNILAWIAENQWVRPVIWEFMRRKTTLKRNVESPFGNGSMVTISEPLDDHMDYDTLWELFLRYTKGLASHCDEVSDSQFEITIVDPIHGGHPEKPLVRLIRHDKAKGEIVDVASVNGLRLLDTRHIRIHRNPLRIEQWTDGHQGKRTYRRMNCEFLQWFLDSVIPEKKASGDMSKAAEGTAASVARKAAAAQAGDQDQCALM